MFKFTNFPGIVFYLATAVDPTFSSKLCSAPGFVNKLSLLTHKPLMK